MMRIAPTLGAVAALALWGCSEGLPSTTDRGETTARGDAELDAVAPEFRGPAGSGEPHLFALPDGRVLATWLQKTEDGATLRMAERSDAGWSEPRTIAGSDRLFVNWADFPSIARMEDGTLVVHWLEKVAAAPYAYHVKLSLSSDGGATWSEPILAHRDEAPTEHGFVSLVPWAEAAAALIWLDGREISLEGPREDRGAMTLRFATLASDGTLGPEVLVDARTCDCCQTALARTTDGLVAAYRDRSKEEIRDITVTRYAGGEWTEPRLVAEDGWHIRGCPVNGPQLAARGDRVAIVWFTAADRIPRVRAAFSSDGGATFGEPIEVNEGKPLGRVDIELLDDHTAVASWLEADDENAGILLRRLSADGTLGPIRRVGVTSGSRASGFPRLALSGDELLVAWTVPGPEGGIRIAALRRDEI